MQAGPSHDGLHHTESLHDGGYPMIRAKMSGSSSSLSSSSSSSSYDPLMETDDDENDDLSETKSVHSSSSSTPRARIPSPAPAPATSPPMPEWSMISNSPRGGPGPFSPLDQSPDWSIPGSKQSPPVWGFPGGGVFEPNRIPSSVFTSKPGNAADWSVASNESLFSIQMGNNSFSRDFVFNSFKSGELPKSDDWGRPSDAGRSPEMNISPLPPLPTVHEVVPEDRKKEAEIDSPKKVLIEAEIDSAKKAEIDSPKKVLIEAEIDSPKKAEIDSPKKVLIKAVIDSPKKDLKEAEVDSPKKAVKEADSPKKVAAETPPPVVVPVKERDVGLLVSVSNASDCKGRQSADTARTSGSTARLSDVSGHSSSSFAFPVLMSDAGRNVSVIPIPEHTTPPKPPEKPVYHPPESPQPPPETQVKNPKEEKVMPPGNRWFFCCPCYAPCR